MAQLQKHTRNLPILQPHRWRTSHVIGVFMWALSLSHKNHVRVPPNRMHSRWRNWATRTTYVLGAAPALTIRVNMTKLHVPGCENAQIQHVWPKIKYLFACVAWESRLRCARYITAPRSRTVLYCIDRPQGEKEGKHGAESTPQISLNFSHIIYIWIESGISRWRNAQCGAIYLHLGRCCFFLRFRLFQIPVSAPSIKCPQKVFSAPHTFTPVYGFGR